MVAIGVVFQCGAILKFGQQWVQQYQEQTIQSDLALQPIVFLGGQILASFLEAIQELIRMVPK